MNPSNLDDDDQTIRIEIYYMKNINTVNDFLQINNNIKINKHGGNFLIS
jgi:hypothetical protein